LDAETKNNTLVQENLYVVTEGVSNGKLPHILPKRFSNLVPKLKASDYDYIIFDMPPVNQTSVTPRLAGHMDIVLLVIEAEQTDREVVERANALLTDSKAKVAAVLNKTRTYVPARLQPEL
jgi:Mrp family chromosome partitioning ATPase